MKTTTWRPDTCFCVVDYDSDNEDTLIKVHERCIAHKYVLDADILHTLRVHNRSCNLMFGEKELTAQETIMILTAKQNICDSIAYDAQKAGVPVSEKVEAQADEAQPAAQV